MTLRQKYKKAKKDNELMHEVINNYPEMKRLYQAYNEPVKNVTHSIMPLKHYKTMRYLSLDRSDDDIKFHKIAMIKEISSLVEENIKFRINENGYERSIEANIFIGEVGETE